MAKLGEAPDREAVLSGSAGTAAANIMRLRDA
jgi:hypothetical protein